MNKAKLKTYTPQARKNFIAAVTVRAQRSISSSKRNSNAQKGCRNGGGIHALTFVLAVE
jgi:hypothetical protein